MPFPRTESELSAAGYKFNHRRPCHRCHAEIEMWDTPRGKLTPLDAGTLASHFGTCPNADDFRKPKPGTGTFSSTTDGYKKGTK